MIKMTMVGLVGALLVGTTALQAAPTSTKITEENLAQCYKQAQNSPDRVSDCLEKELDMVKKEHKDVTERVYLIAKGIDKKKGGRATLANMNLKVNQTFENYVDTECDVMQRMNDGDKVELKNEGLSCQINLYRMRVDMLENRYLSADKE